MFIPLNPPGLPWRNDARTSRVLSQLPFERATVHPSGRSALQHGLERSGFRGRAWAPAFLCRSAIEPLLKLGCPVRFYDVGEDLAPVLAWNEIGSGDVVMAVHFFGICRALEEVQAGCASVGATLIEDCAHTLPDPASTKPVGQRGDLAFFSLRKLLPVAAGGVLVGGVSEGAPQEEGVPWRGGRGKRVLMTAEWVAFRTGINLLPMKSLLREVFGASSRPVERGGAADAGTAAPVLYGRGIGMDLAETVRRRRANFRRLAGDLQGAGVTVPFLEAPEGGCPQALPVLVPEPVGTVRRLRRSGVDACRWPASEGVVTDRSTFPGARSWSRRVVLLPVHQGLSDGNLGRLSERVLRVLGDP